MIQSSKKKDQLLQNTGLANIKVFGVYWSILEYVGVFWTSILAYFEVYWMSGGGGWGVQILLCPMFPRREIFFYN